MFDSPPRSLSMRCPAIMFAVSRTESVIGRMMFLVVSMQTINDISIEGVPFGTRWVSMFSVLFTQP